METIFLIVGVLFLIEIIVISRKTEKLMDELLDENLDLTIRNIDLMKAERDIKNVLDNAEETHEYAVHTVQKIKSILSSNRKIN